MIRALRDPGIRGRRPRALALACGALLVATSTASAAPNGAAEAARSAFGDGTWISLGLLSGTTRLDPGLANYQWDLSPRVAYGVQALAGRGRWSAGARMWSTRTTQSLGIPDTPSPRVRATSWELVGQGRLATLWGTQLLAVASAGRLHLGYRPDRMDIDPAGTGTPITVDFKPVNEWIAGGGLALRSALPGSCAASFEVDGRAYGLDTAHRNGDGIEIGRQSFGDWSARVELAWLYRRR